MNDTKAVSMIMPIPPAAIQVTHLLAVAMIVDVSSAVTNLAQIAMVFVLQIVLTIYL